ncbi:hypothetical protein RDWZM_009131 [Blomia tropicalis]|uniref:Uncharacterized protein n=1 Tax=Blomia tropicalis TaxID=40697 RepID=A0A9Q0RKQ1_BLOTA|nr:hypothetical protein RDWZM_009131 [Blomia tropicalis]
MVRPSLKWLAVNRFPKQIVAIVCITLMGCIYVQKSYLVPRQIYQNDAQESASLLGECQPKSKIAFIKAHKCASSTIQNIFMRYGYFNERLFILPRKGNYLGHPEKFNRNMVPDPEKFGANFSILTHHTRLDYDEIRSLIPDAIFISIIRNPANLFESMFQYYRLQKHWNFNFSDIGNETFTFPKFLKTRRFARRIGVNQMMYDMGFDSKDFDNQEQITQYIQQLDSIFSLVMVSERMDESLILLKDLLCWDYEDVVAFRLNARNVSYKHEMNDLTRKRLSELNNADQQLYDHFVAKFDRQVEQYGRRRMQHDVQRLKQKVKFYYNYCVRESVTKNNSQVIRFVNVKRYSPVCKFMTNSELSVTNFIRNEQLKRYPGSVFSVGITLPPPAATDGMKIL